MNILQILALSLAAASMGGLRTLSQLPKSRELAQALLLGVACLWTLMPIPTRPAALLAQVL